MRSPEPGGNEGFLDDVFRLLEVPHDGQRIAEGHVLEASGYFRERVQVALLGPADQLLQVHAVPLANRCHGRPVTFRQS